MLHKSVHARTPPAKGIGNMLYISAKPVSSRTGVMAQSVTRQSSGRRTRDHCQVSSANSGNRFATIIGGIRVESPAAVTCACALVFLRPTVTAAYRHRSDVRESCAEANTIKQHPCMDTAANGIGILVGHSSTPVRSTRGVITQSVPRQGSIPRPRWYFQVSSFISGNLFATIISLLRERVCAAAIATQQRLRVVSSEAVISAFQSNIVICVAI